MTDNPILAKMLEFLDRWGEHDRDFALCVAFDFIKTPDRESRKHLFRALVSLFADQNADVRFLACIAAEEMLAEMSGDVEMADAVAALQSELGLAVLGEERERVRRQIAKVLKRLDSGPLHLLAYAA